MGTGTEPNAHWRTIINDYSGGVLNPFYNHTPGNLGCMVFHGGGHSATGWNGIVIFDYNSLQYFIVCPGSLSIYPVIAANSECADGQPGAPHTYDTLSIIGPEAGYPKGALISIYRSGTFAEGQQWNSASVHLFDFNNQSVKWQRLYSAGAASWSDGFSAGYASAYDPDLRRIWWVGQGNEVGYTAYFDLTDRQQKKASITDWLNKSPSNSNPDSKIMQLVRSRKLLVMSDTVSYEVKTRRIFWMDTANPAGGWTQATLSMPFPDGYGFGFDWVPDRNGLMCLCVQDPAALYTLTIPDVLTSPWPVIRTAVTGQPFAAAYIIGKRFAWHDGLDMLVYKGQAQDAMQGVRV